MEDNAIVPPPTPLPVVTLAVKPVKTRAEQDTLLENDIAETGRQLALLQASPALLAFAASKGFDTAKLTAGKTLIDAAQASYASRQTAMGAQERAATALPVAFTVAYDATYEFRETVRIHLPDRGARQALATTGKIPRDADNFLTRARAGIEAAGKAPYAATLSKAGYNAAGLAAYAAKLDGFARAKTDYEAAVATAVSATAARDAAYKSLREFSVPLGRLLRLAERKGVR